MNISLLKTSLLTLAIASTIPFYNIANASHHFEAAAVIKNPALSQLDNFVFQSATPDHTVFIMTTNYAPKAGHDGIFVSKNARYNIHIANDDEYKQGHTFTLIFDDENNYTLTDLDNPNAAVGAEGKKIGTGKMNQTASFAQGIKTWAGLVKDPFYGNSPGLHLFREKLNSGSYDPAVWTSVQGKNIFTGRDCGAIVLDIPNAMLGKNVKVFMTTEANTDGTWKQVQYSANPLFSHTMLFENKALIMEHDTSRPTTDGEIKNFVSARTARASALARSQNDPIKYGDTIANRLVPDVLHYETGTKAEYSVEKLNGRDINDDAMSTVLTLLIGKPTDQAIANPKLYSSAFPYVIPASLK